MTQNDFERTLGSTGLACLNDIVVEGYRDYGRLYSQTAPTLTKRTAASVRHDHMIERAGASLPAEFKRVDVHQRVLFDFCGAFMIQFNKLDPEIRRSARNRTIQAQLFDDGYVDCLPGIPASLPIVTVGYVSQADDVGIEAVFAAHIVRNEPEWVLRLDEGREGGFDVPTIVNPNDPRPSKPSRIKRPKPYDRSSGEIAG